MASIKFKRKEKILSYLINRINKYIHELNIDYKFSYEVKYKPVVIIIKLIKNFKIDSISYNYDYDSVIFELEIFLSNLKYMRLLNLEYEILDTLEGGNEI